MSAKEFNSQMYTPNQNLELLSYVQNPDFGQAKLIKRIIHK